MKRALLINAVCGIRSTGRICTDLAAGLEQDGYEVKIAYSRETVPSEYARYAVKIGNQRDVYWHALMTKAFDDRGRWSRRATAKFLQWADEYDPDLLWLHNIHDYVIHLPMLFHWIKSRPAMQVKWTMHDCWAFTGTCMHFVTYGCDQWKTECKECPKTRSRGRLPLVHKENLSFLQKKELFTGISKLTVITPSRWMADLVKESFMKEYPVEVVPNTVDTSVFHPLSSDFRQRYHLEKKYIILGVASAWSQDKGLFDFYRLADELDDRFQIVLIGLTKKQRKSTPSKILSFERTNSKQELVEIYSAADVFFNPTYADTFPTVNLEAEACGTPVVSYRTGGAPETVSRPDSAVIAQGDRDALIKWLQNNIE